MDLNFSVKPYSLSANHMNYELLLLNSLFVHCLFKKISDWICLCLIVLAMNLPVLILSFAPIYSTIQVHMDLFTMSLSPALHLQSALR